MSRWGVAAAADEGSGPPTGPPVASVGGGEASEADLVSWGLCVEIRSFGSTRRDGLGWVGRGPWSRRPVAP